MTVQELVDKLLALDYNAEIQIGIDEVLRQYCLYIDDNRVVTFLDEDVR